MLVLQTGHRYILNDFYLGPNRLYLVVFRLYLFKWNEFMRKENNYENPELFRNGPLPSFLWFFDGGYLLPYG